MLSSNQKITGRQLGMMLTLDALGAALIVLPRRVAEYAAQDGWLIVVSLGLMAVLYGAMTASVARRFPGRPWMRCLGTLFPKGLAKIIGAGLLIKLLLSAGLEIRLFSIVVRLFLLHKTPAAVIGVSLAALCAYTAARGIEVRARVAEILFFIVLLPLLGVFLLSTTEIDFTNLLPPLTAPPEKIVSGTLRLGYVFTGLECLPLALAYLNRPAAARRVSVRALAVASALTLILTVLTLAKFGGTDILAQPWPIIRMMDRIDLPGAFIERQDALMMSFWIMTAFVSIGMLFFYSAVLFEEIRAGNAGVTATSRVPVTVCAAAAALLSFLPLNEAQIYRLLDGLFYTLGVFYLLILPLAVLLAAWWWKRPRMDCKKKGREPSDMSPIRNPFLRLLSLILSAGLLTPLLSGCWDRVEIEKRCFAAALALDKEADAQGEARYRAIAAIPAYTQSGRESQDGMQKLTALGATVSETLSALDRQIGRKIYIGQLKTLFFGEALTADEPMFSAAVQFLYNDSDFNQQALVLSTGDIDRITSARPADGTSAALFFPAFFKYKNKSAGTAFRVEFAELCADIRTNGCAVLPFVEAETVEEKPPTDRRADAENACADAPTAPRFAGATVLNGLKAVGRLSRDGVRGLLWWRAEHTEGAAITALINGTRVSLSVKKGKAHYAFSEADGHLRCNARIEVTGGVEEYAFGGVYPHGDTGTVEALARCCAVAVEDEVKNTAEKMQTDFATDGFGVMEILRKKNYGLYRKYADDLPHAFAEMEIVPEVRVTVRPRVRYKIFSVIGGNILL